MVSNGNIYGPIQVSTDAYLKILTNTDKYGVVLNGRSLCAGSVCTNLLLPSERAAARNF